MTTKNTKAKATRKTATARKAKEAEVSVPFADKKQAFLKALVKKHGEAGVITRSQLLEMHATNPDAFPHPAVVRKDLDYRLLDETGKNYARGLYVVTMSDNPSKVRDQASKAYHKEQAAKEAQKLPKEVRQSPAKLATALKGTNDGKASKRKTKKAA